MQVLTLNCGSSSLRYALIDTVSRCSVLNGHVERIGSAVPEWHASHPRDNDQCVSPSAGHREILPLVFEALEAMPIDAVGHRVVHGGPKYSGAAAIDNAVKTDIDAFSELAPQHNPLNLTGIEIAQASLPSLPHVAVFDTAFHQSLAPSAYRYALPETLYREHGIRRYGFHGTSHRYVARQWHRQTGRTPDETRLISCHLGNGASITAIAGGHSVATSMGLTPLAGLVMGTRSGDIDPGAIFHLHHRGYGIDEIERLLLHESGLRGLSGLSHDMREVLAAQADGDGRAALAVDVYCRRVKHYIGGYLALLNGADAVIFTGGVGEHSQLVRERILDGLDSLGIEMAANANTGHDGTNGCISVSSSRIGVWVIATDEQQAIALETADLLNEKVTH